MDHLQLCGGMGNSRCVEETSCIFRKFLQLGKALGTFGVAASEGVIAGLPGYLDLRNSASHHHEIALGFPGYLIGVEGLQASYSGMIPGFLGFLAQGIPGLPP